MNSYKSIFSIAIFFLTGCMTVMPEVTTGPTANYKNDHWVVPFICVDGKKMSIHGDEGGNAKIPAGKRVVIGVDHGQLGFTPEGYGAIMCLAGTAFTPEEDASYIHSYQLTEKTCASLIEKVTAQGRVPVQGEKTWGCRVQ